MTDVIVCGHCGAKNRVEAGREGEAVCGRCKEPLRGGARAAGGVKVVTDGTFGEEVERAGVPVVVDMWAPWCGPCRMIAPVMEKLAGEMAGRVKFVKVNTDENQATAGRFRIEGIPTLLVMKGGREVDRMVGVMPLEEIRRRVMGVAG